MLKNIGSIFEKRKNHFNQSQNKNVLIKNSFYLFLKNKFGDNLKGFSFVLNYNSKDNSLIITTDNKVIANELTIHLIRLNSFFKDNKIKLDRILIR